MCSSRWGNGATITVYVLQTVGGAVLVSKSTLYFPDGSTFALVGTTLSNVLFFLPSNIALGVAVNDVFPNRF